MQPRISLAHRVLGFVSLVTAACSSGGKSAESGPKWRVLAEDQPGALFSVAGTEADDVWVVGTERGDDEGPTILHFDGEQWERRFCNHNLSFTRTAVLHHVVKRLLCNSKSAKRNFFREHGGKSLLAKLDFKIRV
jgi:hypothetical protein